MANIPEFILKRELHKKYLNRFLNGGIPSFLSNMDSNRSVILFFCVAGLDVLGETEKILRHRKEQIINWIYKLQVVNTEELTSGFQGSTTLLTKKFKGAIGPYQWGHIANTYSCLLSLLILGDNLTRVNRKEIINSMKSLQLEDGSFKGAIKGTENDMRFVFCAAAVSYILNDWNGIDIERMCNFILNSISYDGGIGQRPNRESHCGSTFCALAALALSNNLHRLSRDQYNNLRRWLLNRLDIVEGFNGRPNKPADTCYSFWTGASLKILHAYKYIKSDVNPMFVLMTQDKYGGFSKWVNSGPDPMHTYFGLAGLSLMKYENLNEMYPPLNCTKRVHKRLKALHAQWN
ncbi:hypothetical protein ABEB36_004169 [Hypothenemus hampei]|uniref:Geranylgeranyl transferase type-1 subunit beta n=1 Tax=Hypothenemus hampei TaxID=57062 RepID=A0ABD1F2F6_HYPHA